MANNVRKINIGVSLEDSELISYQYDREMNEIVVKIKLWNARILKIIFFDPIFFVDRYINDIIDLCQLLEKTSFLKEALSIAYDKVPSSHQDKHFQFMTWTGKPSIEIICERIELKTEK